VLNKGLWKLEDVKDDKGKYVKSVLSTLTPDAPGAMSVQEYDKAMADLTNFLAYVAEPYKTKRLAIGVWMMIFLSFLAFVAYWLKSEYWKDVK
jgi:ubiquinol-cytochrome c reductase cytochrome c1 subunit